jgi:hypothetical protein
MRTLQQQPFQKNQNIASTNKAIAQQSIQSTTKAQQSGLQPKQLLSGNML